MTTLPALSTPCTWNTFLARSTPMVLTCIWTTPSDDSLFNDHPMAHSMPGAGVVHHIILDRFSGDRWLVDVRFIPIAPVPKPERRRFGFNRLLSARPMQARLARNADRES